MTVVLFGGTSDERRVSVASAQHLAELLPKAAFFFQAATGQVFQVSTAELTAHADPFRSNFVPTQDPCCSDLAELASRFRKETFFLALHGGEGEDGTVQTILETHGVAYTGSGSSASARAFDKRSAKQVCAAAGIRVAQSIEIHGPDAARLRNFVREVGPAMVKPACGGSSVGLFPLRSEGEVEGICAQIPAQQTMLVESFIAGREFTVGVVDWGKGASPLPASEVVMDANLSFDYEGKYLGRGSTEITPAQVSDSMMAELQTMALAAHHALGCEGYSRTDIIWSSAGPTFLETNTLPGLTRASFIPQQLAAAGHALADFLEAQMRLARERV